MWSLRNVSTMIRTTFCPFPPPVPRSVSLFTPHSESQAPAPSMASPAVEAPAAFRKSLLVNVRRRAVVPSGRSKNANAREHIRTKPAEGTLARPGRARKRPDVRHRSGPTRTRLLPPSRGGTCRFRADPPVDAACMNSTNTRRHLQRIGALAWRLTSAITGRTWTSGHRGTGRVHQVHLEGHQEGAAGTQKDSALVQDDLGHQLGLAARRRRSRRIRGQPRSEE